MPTQQQRQANAEYFTNIFQTINEGGIYAWTNKGHIFTKHNGYMVAPTLQAWKDIKNITPRGWARQNIKLAN
jgi:hypothetical protein